MPYPHDEAKLKSWETGLSAQIAKDPKPWDDYDLQIKTVCQVYDKHLAGVSGYVPLDWQLIKAITWVESGAAIEAWKTAPMQIGVNGDPGLRELLTSPTGKLILPPEYAQMLTVSNVPANGNLNIEAGVGYVLKVTANFGMLDDPPPLTPAQAFQNALNAPPNPFDQMMRNLQHQPLGNSFYPGLNSSSSLDAAFMQALRPSFSAPPASPPSPPQPPAPPVTPATASSRHGKPSSKHKKKTPHHPPKQPAKPVVHKHLAIIGWKPRTLQLIAHHYNAGDGNYADKLQFALDIMSGKIKPEAAPAPPPKPKPKHKTPLRIPHPGRH